MRLGCFLVIVTLALLVSGFNGIRNALAFQRPKTVHCDDFTRQAPTEGWFQVQGCVLSVHDAAWEESKTGTIRRAFVPVWGERQFLSDRDTSPSQRGEKVYLVVETREPAILDTLSELKTVDEGDEAKQIQFFEKNIERLVLHRNLGGMLKAGVESEETTRDQVAALNSKLAPNYVMLEDGKKPDLGLSVLAFGSGLVLLIGMGLWFLMRSR